MTVAEALNRQNNVQRWLIKYVEFAFRGVTLDDGRTIYEAANRDAYGFMPQELSLVQSAERIDWRRVPADHLYQRTDAIFFLDSKGRRFYTPAILTAILTHGTRDGFIYDCFMLDLGNSVREEYPNQIPFDELYNRKQVAALVRFCKFAIHNAPSELGGQEVARVLNQLRSAS